MATEPEQDLTSQRARRRRALAGVLAGAAIAVPGVAFAAGGDASSSSSFTVPPTGGALPVQEEQAPESAPDRDGDGRDCPEKDGGSSAGETAL